MKLVKTGTEKMFYDLDTEAEMVKHGMYDTSLHYNVSDMTAKDFFSKINDPDDPNFYYWSAGSLLRTSDWHYRVGCWWERGDEEGVRGVGRGLPCRHRRLSEASQLVIVRPQFK